MSGYFDILRIHKYILTLRDTRVGCDQWLSIKSYRAWVTVILNNVNLYSVVRFRRNSCCLPVIFAFVLFRCIRCKPCIVFIDHCLCLLESHDTARVFVFTSSKNALTNTVRKILGIFAYMSFYWIVKRLRYVCMHLKKYASHCFMCTIYSLSRIVCTVLEFAIEQLFRRIRWFDFHHKRIIKNQSSQLPFLDGLLEI